MSRTLATPSKSTVSTPCRAAMARRSGTRSMPMTLAAPWCLAIRAHICPTGPRPPYADGRGGLHVGVLHRLPGRRQDVGQVEEAVIGRALPSQVSIWIKAREQTPTGLASRCALPPLRRLLLRSLRGVSGIGPRIVENVRGLEADEAAVSTGEGECFGLSVDRLASDD